MRKIDRKGIEEAVKGCDSFYTALDGARVAREGLLKAGLMAVEAVRVAGEKEEEDGSQVQDD